MVVAATVAPIAARKSLHSSPHLVPVLECVLSERLATAELFAARRDDAKLRAPAKTAFHALRAPSVSPVDYLHRLVRHSHCSRSVFVTALMYLDRAAARRAELRLNALNVHRLLLTCVLLATKFLDDVLYDNAHFAFVGGLDVAELNQLELALLDVLDFRLHVSARAFRDYETRLVHMVMASANSAFDHIRGALYTLVDKHDRRDKKQHAALKALPPSSPVSGAED